MLEYLEKHAPDLLTEDMRACFSGHFEIESLVSRIRSGKNVCDPSIGTAALDDVGVADDPDSWAKRLAADLAQFKD